MSRNSRDFADLTNLYPGEKITVSQDADLGQTVSLIKKAIQQGASNVFVKDLARKSVASGNPERFIHKWAYENVYYKPDPLDEQNIRTVENILRERVGNCVSYATIVGSVLLAAGIPFKLALVSYSQPGAFEHIYVQTKNAVIDPCIGQDQTRLNSDLTRESVPAYGRETKYKFKTLVNMPKLNILNGNTPEHGLGVINLSYRSRHNIRRSGLRVFPVYSGPVNGIFDDFSNWLHDSSTQLFDWTADTFVDPLSGTIKNVLGNPQCLSSIAMITAGVPTTGLSSCTTAGGVPGYQVPPGVYPPQTQQAGINNLMLFGALAVASVLIFKSF